MYDTLDRANPHRPHRVKGVWLFYDSGMELIFVKREDVTPDKLKRALEKHFKRPVELVWG